MHIRTEQLVDEIRALALPPEGWCVVGGAMMQLREIRELSNDIDILMTRALWDTMVAGGAQAFEGGTSAPHCASVLSQSGLRIDFLATDSFNNVPNIDAYLTATDQIRGLLVITVRAMLEWKQCANRPKDIADILLLEKALFANTE